MAVGTFAHILPTLLDGVVMAVVRGSETKHGKRYRVRYRTPDNRQTDKRGFKRNVTPSSSPMPGRRGCR
jgi:hypothetical protein